MVKISEQITHNYLAFSEKFPKDISENATVFRGENALLESYARVAALNALKVDLVSVNFPTGAAEFFFEAHNDALISHVNASIGSWRPALQSLRSFMENCLAAIFYMDHPVEYKKWESGNFRITPRELRAYVIEHPTLEKLAKDLGLQSELDSEYSTLSKAVHGSNSLFRMTSAEGKTNFAKASLPDLGKWSARERSVVSLCVVLLVALLKDHLDGAKQQEVRSALAVAVSKKGRDALKKHYGVSIPSP